VQKTLKVLLDIATRRASIEEAVRATFTLAEAGVATGGGQTTPLVSLSKAPQRALRVGRRAKVPPVSSYHDSEQRQCQGGD
jgi:hypothetical protein